MDLAVIPKIPRAGDIIGQQYVLGKELGRGSMGVVFEAEQLGLDRQVAIKLLLPRALVIEGVVERFQRGAKLASSLSHPNAVTIHTIGMHSDPDGGSLPYLVMEHLEGMDLYDHITVKGRLSLVETVWILGEALGSLSQAHSKGIIHRDLKPENLFISEREDGSKVVKVLDFGLAKAVMEGWEDRNRRLTATGMTCGTPEYMAPEQAVGEEVITPALDVYGVGCIIYHMLVGEPPFRGKSPMAVALKHVAEMPAPLPEQYRSTAIEAVLKRALAKRPEMRFADASELAKAVAVVKAGGDVLQIEGWPSEAEIVRPYRDIGEMHEEVVEDKTWALATTEMPAVEDLNSGPTRLIERVPMSASGDLRFGSVTDMFTPESVTDVSAAPKPHPTVELEPGSVSVNIPNAVTVDLGAAKDEGFEEVKTVVSGPPGEKPRAVESQPPLRPLVARPSRGERPLERAPKRRHLPRLKSPPRAPVKVEPARVKRKDAATRKQKRKKNSSVGLWIMVMMAALIGGVVISLSFMIYGAQECNVRLVSTPAGAEVFVGADRVGKTPHVLKVSGQDAVDVVFKKKGFKDLSRRIELDGGMDEVKVKVKLKKATGDW